MQNFISLAVAMLFITATGSAQTHSKETILIETEFGNMKIKLFEETPQHKQNFLKLVNEHYFDSLLFHRVINHFMIQGGDHLSKHAKPGDSLGHGDLGYLVPAEFNNKIYHRKGRLAAARDGDDVNPEQASSPTQFYIVMGKQRTMEDLKKYEDRINKSYYVKCTKAFLATDKGKSMKTQYNRLKNENKTDSAEVLNKQIEDIVKAEYNKKPEYKFNEEQVKLYTTEGGTPHLDGSYTIFGEVIEGLEVIDKIATVPTDKRDRPLTDIRMKIRILQ